MEDLSESDLLESPPSFEPCAEDDESDEVEFELDNEEDDGDGPLTQPLENPSPEIFRASRYRLLSDVDTATHGVYGDVIRQTMVLIWMGLSGMMHFGKLIGWKF